MKANFPQLSDVADTARQTVLDYNEMAARLGAWTMPEHWLQNAIARMYHQKNFYVAVEAPSKCLLKWYFGDDSEGRKKFRRLEKGRIDIALFNYDPAPRSAHTIGLIEVKKYAQKDNCSDDARRLRELAHAIESVETALVIAHVQRETQERREQDLVDLLDEIEVARDAAEISRFTCEGVYCASVVADLGSGRS